MFVILGGVVVLGCVLAGFMMAGGHIGALVHPSEFVTIGGAAAGALILMTPTKVLKDLVTGILKCLKGSPYNKQAYNDMFKLLYDLLRTARRDGLLALDSHVSNPHESEIFNKYPKLAADHHVVEFICGALVPVLDGTAKPEQLAALLEAELRVVEEEHHAPIMALSKTADAMPGFGIVAAVLGIVVTMGAIGGPAEEIGEKVGAALVGTFLGILISYGFLAPDVRPHGIPGQVGTRLLQNHRLHHSRRFSTTCLPKWPSNKAAAAWRASRGRTGKSWKRCLRKRKRGRGNDEIRMSNDDGNPKHEFPHIRND